MLARANPVNPIVDPCRDLLEENERLIDATAKENERLTANLSTAMLLLGLGGPLSGLPGGYGIARGLSRSIHRLSVHVQDISQHLEQDVGSVRLTTSGDIRALDRQLEHVVGRVAEVTERLQRQHRDMFRAQQLSAVGQLAASIAHEVRNPLAAIKLLVEAALRVNNPRPFTADNLRLVHREVLRLEQTLQGFLDFARPPSLQRSSCDLREVIAQAVDLVRARARQQQVGIDVICPGTPVQAHVDGTQLGTVLVNLLLNALDAMPREGRLGIRLETVRTGARLTVIDTGPGIAPEIAPRLFTPFASTKPTGSGLGLSISRRIVEDHGGTLTAANRSEGGARFTVTLPLLSAVPQNHHSPSGC
jgi:signal transduction histidine kinase